jgi:hypothetical protein
MRRLLQLDDQRERGRNGVQLRIDRNFERRDRQRRSDGLLERAHHGLELWWHDGHGVELGRNHRLELGDDCLEQRRDNRVEQRRDVERGYLERDEPGVVSCDGTDGRARW